MTITQTELIDCLSYNPHSGIFIWLKSRKGITAGQRAGYTSWRGYRYIKINRKEYAEHRLVWLFMTGQFPNTRQQLDHINGKKDDNRFCNLRLANYVQQQGNRAPRRDNSLGIRGVRKTENGKWMARIKRNYRNYHLGTFDTLEDAMNAYAEAADQHFGEFARY